MNASFVKTETVLDRILARKVQEVSAARSACPLPLLQAQAQLAPPARDMLAALQREHVALIAEVKCASPSKGRLSSDFAPVMLAATYAHNGAAAISVLTDEPFFRGSLQYLRAVRAAVDLPLLRKDFLLDAYQVVEARAAGADAILLIAAALDDAQLQALQAQAQNYGMAALIEVHDEWEMERALRLGAPLIGINNRDLRDFTVDLSRTARLAHMAADDCTLVAESGIFCADDVRAMGRLGTHAILVGEALVKARDTASLTRELSSQPRGAHGKG